VFRLTVDTRPRPAVTVVGGPDAASEDPFSGA
jgi:hypothetical protein